jgi:hypothetical protein
MTQPITDIRFDPDTQDYIILIDGEYVGSTKRHHDAQVKANSIVFDRLSYDAERAQLATLNDKIQMFSQAATIARADGRLIDAARYRVEGLHLLAEKHGLTYEQLMTREAA